MKRALKKDNMKRRYPCSLFGNVLILTLQVLCIHLVNGQPPSIEIGQQRVYRIEDQSSLTITGTTNMTHFSCRSTESLPAQVFYIEELDDENCTIFFTETVLNLMIESLDCGNKMMNRDMYKAMNAHIFPLIRMDLLQVAEEKCDISDDAQRVSRYSALTRITLNGKSKEYWMRVIVQETGLHKFRFQSDKVFAMSDFGITPPTAVFGMVKVSDQIKISLDMVVSVE